MLEVIVTVVVAVGSFVGGVYVGMTQSKTVDNAIAYIEGVEKQAQAVLAKITAHKAT